MMRAQPLRPAPAPRSTISTTTSHFDSGQTRLGRSASHHHRHFRRVISQRRGPRPIKPKRGEACYSMYGNGLTVLKFSSDFIYYIRPLLLELLLRDQSFLSKTVNCAQSAFEGCSQRDHAAIGLFSVRSILYQIYHKVKIRDRKGRYQYIIPIIRRVRLKCINCLTGFWQSRVAT